MAKFPKGPWKFEVVKLHQIQMNGPTCCFNQTRKTKRCGWNWLENYYRLPFWDSIFSYAIFPMYPYLINIRYKHEVTWAAWVVNKHLPLAELFCTANLSLCMFFSTQPAIISSHTPGWNKALYHEIIDKLCKFFGRLALTEECQSLKGM